MIFKNKIPLFYYSLHKFTHSTGVLRRTASTINFKKKKENYGDIISKYIVEKISNKKVQWYDPRIQNGLKKNYFVVGSILVFTNSKSIVWGSGIIDKEHPVANCDFRAVRGPQTRERLRTLGYNCPEIYGDPGLLLPLFYDPKVEKQYELGIVPHFRDFNRANALFGSNSKIRIINLLTHDIERTTLEILSCRKIISSSLHGLVIAHTYDIPAVWVKLSHRLHGDGVKFQDYLESVGIDNYKGEWVSNQGDLEREILKLNESNSLPGPGVIPEIRKKLMEACPFL